MSKDEKKDTPPPKPTPPPLKLVQNEWKPSKKSK